VKNKKKIVLILCSVILLLFTFASSFSSFTNNNCAGYRISAICPTDRNNLYAETKYSSLWELLKATDPISQSFRLIGWWFVRGLSVIVNGLDGLSENTFTIMKDFFDSEFISTGVENMNIIAYLILGIIIMFIGIKFMLGQENEIKNVVINIFLVMGTIGVSTMLFDYGFKIVPAVNTYFGIGDEDLKLADELVLNSITDIEYYREQIEQENEVSKRNNLTETELKYFDINLSANVDIFNRVIVGFDETNNVPIIEKYDSKGFFGFGAVYIYKYQINFFAIIVELILIILLLFVLYYKQIKHILELGIAQIFYNLIAVFGAYNKSKINALISIIAKSFLSVIMLSFAIYYYIKFSSFLATRNINFIQRIVFMVANFSFATGNSVVISALFGVQNDLGNNFTNTYFKARALGRMGKAAGKMITAPSRAFGKYAMPSIMQNAGNKSGGNIANQREKFFNDPNAQYSDYDGKKEQKYLASDYQMEDVGQTDNKFLNTVAEKTGVSKHLNTFNEARRKAYEQKFPTSSTSQRMARNNQELEQQQQDIYKKHGSKYGESGSYAQDEINMKESLAENLEQGKQEFTLNQKLDKMGLNKNADTINFERTDDEMRGNIADGIESQQETNKTNATMDKMNMNKSAEQLKGEQTENEMRGKFKQEMRDEQIRQNIERNIKNNKTKATMNRLRNVSFNDEEKKIAKVDWSKILTED
jgi:Predicted membrane protein